MCADEYILFFYLTEKIREFFADVYEVANMEFWQFCLGYINHFWHKIFNLTVTFFFVKVRKIHIERKSSTI